MILSKLILLSILPVLLFAQSTIDNNLKELMRYAIANSPEIKMSESMKESTKKRAIYRSSISDPELMFGIMNLPLWNFSFTEEMMTMKTIQLTQMLPFPGYNDAKKNFVLTDTLLIDADFRIDANKLISEIYTTVIDAKFSLEQYKLSLKSIELMEQLLPVVRVMYEVNEESIENSIKLEIEIEMMRENSKMYSGMYNESISMLKNLTNNDNVEPFISGMIFDETNFDVENFEATNIANPLLLKPEASKLSAIKMREMNEFEKYPMFSFSVQYGFRNKMQPSGMEQKDMLSLMAGLTLPLNYGGKTTAMLEESEFMIKYSEAQSEMLLRELSTMTASSIEKIKSLRERVKITGVTLKSKSKLAFELALTAYQNGKTSYMSLIEALNKMIEVDKMLLSLKKELNQQVAVIGYLTGATLTEVLNEK
ncbi:MAG: TolC family protein [Ignavibacteriaceae bacterium]|nr:TolC family protein [Ignavibacteriaceae bacterium]